MALLSNPDRRAVYNKPQIRALFTVQDQVTNELCDWLLEEFEMYGNQGMIIARPVVEAAIAARFKATAPGAPSVQVNLKVFADYLLIDSQVLAQQMNERNEWDAILAEQQRDEDYAKHA